MMQQNENEQIFLHTMGHVFFRSYRRKSLLLLH